MQFIPLIGQKLKDDVLLDVLESHSIEVTYDFDRLHENTEDVYWAAAKDAGFQLRFDATQTLDVIFLYAMPIDGFSAIESSACDVQFFASISAVEAHAAREKLSIAKGEADLFGVPVKWILIERPEYSTHYEFRQGQLALVTIQKDPMGQEAIESGVAGLNR